MILLRFWLVVALTFLLACDRGEVNLVEPALGPSDADELSVSIRLADGSEVPEAYVELNRVRDYQAIETRLAHSDGSGLARFEDLPSGMQWVSVFKHYTGSAAESLPDEWPVAAVAAGAKVLVDGPTDTVLVARPPKIGTLLISEVYAATPDPFESGGSYYGSLYVEVYNNGPEVSFLDGVLLGKGYSSFFDDSRFGHHACADSEPMRVDPDGYWASKFWRFPGSGAEYPIGPGEAMVIAVSAIDHREIHSSMLDLTNADFEFRPADLAFPDNPVAPDLQDVGPEQFIVQAFFGTSGNWFLASPTDLESLPRQRDPASGDFVGEEFLRIPKGDILDVIHIWWDNAGGYTQVGPSPICLHPTNPLFDALPGGFETLKDPYLSAQRRVVTARDGRVVLLDSNVSAVDFHMTTRTPGFVPEAEW